MNDNTCQACEGELRYLGKFGSSDVYRCRDCGLDTFVEIEKTAWRPLNTSEVRRRQDRRVRGARTWLNLSQSPKQD